MYNFVLFPAITEKQIAKGYGFVVGVGSFVQTLASDFYMKDVGQYGRICGASIVASMTGLAASYFLDEFFKQREKAPHTMSSFVKSYLAIAVPLGVHFLAQEVIGDKKPQQQQTKQVVLDKAPVSPFEQTVEDVLTTTPRTAAYPISVQQNVSSSAALLGGLTGGLS